MFFLQLPQLFPPRESKGMSVSPRYQLFVESLGNVQTYMHRFILESMVFGSFMTTRRTTVAVVQVKCGL